MNEAPSLPGLGKLKNLPEMTAGFIGKWVVCVLRVRCVSVRHCFVMKQRQRQVLLMSLVKRMFGV
jgi:hypothetical protein